MAGMIHHALQDGVATLTLNRPQKFNALGMELLTELLAALQACVADDRTRAIVLTGSGSAFSGGGDVDWFNQVLSGGALHAQSEIGRLMCEAGNPVTHALAECPVPVVAAVNGPCVGGAVGVALACDVVVAARSAYFMLPQAPRLGVVPDLGSSWVLPRLLGRGRALAMALLGERIDAERAEQWGLIWRCVDDAELAEVALSVALRLSAVPATALRDTRCLIDGAGMHTLQQQLDAEHGAQMLHVTSEFFKQACSRFAHRSHPS